MDLVTVVVPIYNVEKYLKRCVESIISQTYKNIEILLVNDGSPDKSDLIMKKYEKKDNRIRCFYKENGGLADTRNYAIKKAKGKYICFIDSDDYIDKTYIEKLLNAIKKNNAQISWCDFATVNDYGKTGNIVQTEEDLWSFEMPSTCNKLYLKDLFTKNNIEFPKGLWYEDLATTPRLIFLSKKIVRVDEELYNYYFNVESITKTYCKKALDVKNALSIVYDFLNKKNLLQDKKIHNIIEYMFLYSVLNTAFRISMANDVALQKLKDFIYWAESKFDNMYNNEIAKKRLDFTRKILIILIKLRLFKLLRVIIRFVKKRKR